MNPQDVNNVVGHKRENIEKLKEMYTLDLIDEERDINVKFPEEYFSEELKGKDAIFKVKLHEIKKKELPELNDDFAKDTSEFDTLDELKASIKEKLEHENEHKAKYEMEDAAIKAVTETTEVEIPSGMIETELDNMIKDMETRMSYQGIMMEQYLQMMGKTMEEFRKENEEQAKSYNPEKTRMIDFFVGQVMKKSRGKANPAKTMEMLREELNKYIS